MNRIQVIEYIAAKFSEPLAREISKKIAESELGYKLSDNLERFPYQIETQNVIYALIRDILISLSEQKAPFCNEDTRTQ